ncbi:DNA polymerase III delta subunit [Lysobacter dokdonensis DS-58]|uniref:DNA polymerase III subunit delta n=1 Tax=Lysobacter dokdonensis DS-58 TaxID=1300345 RepID=A0A0A2X681_9GAMM|nr:DNA polymerase III subunit delta [Lysobacter dokdonensis]KGQ20719.1 DNA polymerase III delta subunit [Lysobacter dokdonensis DS-58]
MAELRPDRLAAQLASEPLRPAYLIAGPEALVVLEAADAVRAAAREQGIGDREVYDIEGRDPDWDSVAAAFQAPGLFAARRVVEIRMPGGKPGKDGAEILAQFAADPPPDVVLLITAGEWSKQHGGKWSEALGRIGHQLIAWQVKPHELNGWIDARMRARGLRADRDAVQALADRVEGNLLAAAQEIDKLSLLAEGRTLDVAAMESLVSDSARYDVFRLVDAAMNGQATQVARMLHGLKGEGEAVPALLGMVAMELNRAALLARVAARGGNLQAEFKAQRIWDSKQAAYTRALKRHDVARWERFAAEIGHVDRIAKGRPQWGRDPHDAWLALERVLLAVADPRAMQLLG